MQKITAVGLAIFALLVFISIGCGFAFDSERGQKHLGPVTVRNQDRESIEFIRPNGEFFETKFQPGWNQPSLGVGDALKDLVYTDGKDGQSVFVKAVLDHKAPPVPPSNKILYEQGSWAWAYWCSSSNNVCQVEQGKGTPFYLWKDGGYRDKPERHLSK